MGADSVSTSQVASNGSCESRNGSKSTFSQSDHMRYFGDLQQDEFNKFMDSIDAVMFDCDGVLWVGSRPLKKSQELVKRFRAIGKKVFFITNNSTKTREEFLTKFNKLGYEATIDEIVSTSYLAALTLKEKQFNKKVYVIGTSGVVGELNNVGIESLPIGPDNSLSEVAEGTLDQADLKKIPLDKDVGAVIVGFDFHINYIKLFKAASYLRDPNCIFIGTNTDESFPVTESLVIPGTGTLVRAVETASSRKANVMGKPSTMPFDFISRHFKLDPKRTLMVGDRGNTDIAFGYKCNLWTLLVLTGVTKLPEVESWNQNGSEEEKTCVPNFYLESVEHLFNLMELYK